MLSGPAVTSTTRFRGRVTGTVVKELVFNNSDQLGVFVAQYYLPRGEYVASVDLRYRAFDPHTFSTAVLLKDTVLSLRLKLPSTTCPRSVAKLEG